MSQARIPKDQKATCERCGRSIVAFLMPRHAAACSPSMPGGATRHPLFEKWRSMRRRCHDHKAIDFYRYGGRGIRVCANWRASFVSFAGDMGACPPGASLDRIDNDAGYDCGHCEDCVAGGRPANCRWATASEQQSNRRVTRRLTHDGRTQTVTAWANEFGLTRFQLFNRIRHGWDVERALTTPVMSTAESAEALAALARSSVGEKNSNSKLSDADAMEIIRALKSGIRECELERALGAKKGAFNKIASRATRQHLWERVESEGS